MGQQSDAAEVNLVIQQYDGSRWDEQHAKIPRKGVSPRLTAVTAIAADDAWAVGNYMAGHAMVPLIEHWDGSRWRYADGPTPGHAWLTAVSGASASDLWAVGQNDGQPLAEHWDGQRWRLVDFPDGTAAGDPPSGGNLSSLSALSSDDVWAAGESVASGESTTLIGHWDGTAWTVVPSPTPGKQQFAHLSGISAVASDDVWAVGDYAAGTATLPLIEHWDGESWVVVEAPHLTGHLRVLSAVVARASDDVWAVGARGGKTVILHFDGDEWSQVAAPPGDEGSFLSGVDATAADDAWTVGANAEGRGFRPLRLHWDGTVWG